MSASSRYAMSWASHDSSQCSTPASGATTASDDEQRAEGAPCFTARTTSALSDADADQRSDARDAEHERDGELRAVRRATMPSRTRDEPAASPCRSRDRVARLARRPAPRPRARGVGLEPLDRRGRSTIRRRRAPSLRLRGHQPVIRRRRGPSARRGVPALRHAPLVEHEDAVRADHARQAVREDQRRAPAASAGRAPPGSPPRSPRRRTTAPRRGRGSARPAGARARWRCAGAGRPTAARRARRPPSGSPRAAGR